MITIWLKRVAARRAYTRAQNRDAKAFQAWCAGDRSKGPTGVVLCDHTQRLVTDAWRRMVTANTAWYAGLEELN